LNEVGSGGLYVWSVGFVPFAVCGVDSIQQSLVLEGPWPVKRGCDASPAREKGGQVLSSSLSSSRNNRHSAIDHVLFAKTALSFLSNQRL
jgi:hypothetical protein